MCGCHATRMGHILDRGGDHSYIHGDIVRRQRRTRTLPCSLLPLSYCSRRYPVSLEVAEAAAAAVVRYGHARVTNCALLIPLPTADKLWLPYVLGPHLGARTWLGLCFRQRIPSILTITSSRFESVLTFYLDPPWTRLATSLHHMSMGNVFRPLHPSQRLIPFFSSVYSSCHHPRFFHR